MAIDPSPATAGASGNASGNANATTNTVALVSAAPRLLSSMLTPFQTNIDPTSKEGILQWQHATKPPHGWKPLAVSVENRTFFTDALKDFAMKFSIILFKIPMQGDGTIHPNVRVIACRDRPNYNLSSFVNILDEHNTKLKGKEPAKYSLVLWQ